MRRRDGLEPSEHFDRGSPSPLRQSHQCGRRRRRVAASLSPEQSARRCRRSSRLRRSSETSCFQDQALRFASLHGLFLQAGADAFAQGRIRSDPLVRRFPWCSATLVHRPSPASVHANRSSANRESEGVLETCTKRWIDDRSQRFDSIVKLSLQQVARTDEVLRRVRRSLVWRTVERGVLSNLVRRCAESVDPRVFEVTADDRAHGNCLGESLRLQVEARRSRAR